jgi:hypothetical protein
MVSSVDGLADAATVGSSGAVAKEKKNTTMSSSQASFLPHATRELASFAARTGFADIPSEVIERIKLSLIDGLGVCLHGATLPWTRKVCDLVLEEGGKPLA